MPDYKNTKIYRIPIGNENYYGHTTQPLHKRLNEHRKDFCKGKKLPIYEAMRQANMIKTDINIFLVEDYPCNNVYEAKARERWWIERNKSRLNTYIPNRTEQERYADNRENILEQQKQKYARNREHVLARVKAHYEQNKQEKRDYHKQYREKNKEHLAAKQNEKYSQRVECEICGVEMRFGSLRRHKQRKHSK